MTLILTRREVARLLELDECIAAVEGAFRAHGEGRTAAPAVLGFAARDGSFHIKAAALESGARYFAAKINGNFFHNGERFGLPRIQGVIALCDADTGSPLALLDSIEITILRTGAATGVAATYLARPDSRVATICGCGAQGRIQLRSLARVLPLRTVHAWDVAPEMAGRFAGEMAAELGLAVTPATELESAVATSDVVVTCTPARRFFLQREWVAPGTFVAAVGADSADKQEIDPALLAANPVIVDLLEQCAAIGDLHHALAAGVMTPDDVRAELGQVVAGRRPGRMRPEEIVIFDSTGTALQDVAAAAVVYEKAVRAGVGLAVELGA
ncbi:MAG: ornithine cyclodeaminase family protein [Gemmatimonadetes bacterium]|nr:ornithine cyclodeaminase family protein [Gemmatimonadota bacterium]